MSEWKWSAKVRYRRKTIFHLENRDNYYQLMHDLTKHLQENFSFKDRMKVSIIIKNHKEAM